MGEHCAKVYNTSYNTLNEKESYASYETDNKLLISERNVQKTCQVEEGIQPPSSDRSTYLQGIYIDL